MPKIIYTQFWTWLQKHVMVVCKRIKTLLGYTATYGNILDNCIIKAGAVTPFIRNMIAKIESRQQEQSMEVKKMIMLDNDYVELYGDDSYLDYDDD